ncbi:MAG: hypothetical protein R3Y24_10735 [Eubacteriales bacterium]
MNKIDQWNSLSDFLSNMIIKYADVLDIESLSAPATDTEGTNIIDNPKKSKENNIREDIEIKEIA